MGDREDEEAADRTVMFLEGEAFQWVTEHGIDKAIDAAASTAGPHATKLASAIHGLVTQAWIEGADTGFQARKKLHDADKERADELEELFDLTWAADMRAVKLWRTAHPGSDLVLPDHAKLVFWLLEQIEIAPTITRGIAATSPPPSTVLDASSPVSGNLSGEADE